MWTGREHPAVVLCLHLACLYTVVRMCCGMAKKIIFISMLLSTLVVAEPCFDTYHNHLTKLGKYGIIGANIVTSTTQCEKYCLDSNIECQAANMIPIARTGKYSCELIRQASPPLNLIFSERAFTIYKISINILKFRISHHKRNSVTFPTIEIWYMC